MLDWLEEALGERKSGQLRTLCPLFHFGTVFFCVKDMISFVFATCRAGSQYDTVQPSQQISLEAQLGFWT